MLTTLLYIILIGVIGYLVVTYIPMIEPIKTVVVIAFVLVAIYFLIHLFGGAFPVL